MGRLLPMCCQKYTFMYLGGMMRLFKCGLLLIAVMLMLSACSRNVLIYKQAKKQYESGNLDQALMLNVQSLQLKSNYVKAQDLLKQVYPRAVENREITALRLRNSVDELRWDKMVDEYTALIQIQTAMAGLPLLIHPKTGQIYKYEPKDYSSQLKESKTNAAEFHYQKAYALMQSSALPDVQKAAALEFKLAMGFVPNYKDSRALYDSSRKLAVKRIAIIAFEDKTGTRSKYGGIPDMLVDSIIGGILNDKASSEFVEIITRSQINAVLAEQQLSTSGLVDEASAARVGQLLGAHEILTGKILQINVLPTRTTSVELKETAKVEVPPKEAPVSDAEGSGEQPKEYIDVSCLYSKYTKTSGAQISASYTIVDVSTGAIKVQDQFTGVFNWSDTWARKGAGDERALSSATKTLISKTEPMPPSEIEMVNAALKHLSELFVSQIKSYVK